MNDREKRAAELEAMMPTAGSDTAWVQGPVIDNGGDAGVAHRYRHPQGGYIEVYSDGTMQAWNAAGKKKSTSATPEKLAAGHGAWTEVDS